MMNVGSGSDRDICFVQRKCQELADLFHLLQ
jgi:hypothetical protein